MNIMPLAAAGGGPALPGAMQLPARLPVGAERAAYLGVRPEDLSIAGQGDKALIEGEVALTEDLGEVTLVHVDIGSEGEPVVAKLPGSVSLERGTRLRLAAEAEKLRFFGADGRSLTRLE